MSLLDSNLLDLQPQTNGMTPLDSTPSRSLMHYQRVDKKCISLQILPYARPYVIPISKIKTSSALFTVLETLPEVWTSTGDNEDVKSWVDYVSFKFEGGSWRLVDEAGLVVRIQDWEDLISPGAQFIIDTNGAIKRESEKYEIGAPQAQDAPANKAPETPKAVAKPKLPIDTKQPSSQEDGPSRTQSKWSTDNWTAPATVPAEEPSVAPQGDPEWMSWNQLRTTSESDRNQPAPNNENAWNNTGLVVPTDDGFWGDENTFNDDQSTSTAPKRNDSDSIQSPTGSWANQQSGPSKKRYGKQSWHHAQATGSAGPVNAWDKAKFPPKVHLTFYTPFQLPRKYPPTPQPPYCRFSVEIDRPMWQVAERVINSQYFKEMQQPENHRDCEYVFMELRYTLTHGKPSLEKGRERRIKGNVTLAQLGLSVDGGEEGLGRYALAHVALKIARTLVAAILT
ncbi:hypothetical protein ABW19_dt0210221 [Dactylella cylindrospora]|nr:hypothetical protein ABW19_dt0210221 [Dactylella cylindrospora]